MHEPNKDLGKDEWKALHMVLYEVLLPNTHTDDGKGVFVHDDRLPIGDATFEAAGMVGRSIECMMHGIEMNRIVHP